MNELDIEIVSLYMDKEMSIADISVELGISATYIRKALKIAKVFQPGKNIFFTPANDAMGKIKDDIEEIYRRYRSGERLDDIGANYGVSRSTVYKCLQVGGYEIRQKGIWRRAGKVAVSPEKFIETWQSAVSIDAVVDALGMSKAAVSSRAYLYRQKGVPLKSFKSRKRKDWDDLADFALGLGEDENV